MQSSARTLTEARLSLAFDDYIVSQASGRNVLSFGSARRTRG
ncbi:MAG: hypothetical protein QNI84_17145 [Henriciella sp.]|nr:hypothetical protein [Henriciella sp.]